MSTIITDVAGLQAMENDLAGDYVLGGNIDASATSAWNEGQGFMPIGISAPYFTGTFDGAGYTITGLLINRSATSYIGLFACTVGATIQDVTLADFDITGKDYTGSLVGDEDGSTITDVIVTGVDVTGEDNVGGLFGRIYTSILSGCSVTGIVANSGYYLGGFAGIIEESTLTSCYSTATVNGSTTASFAGGFVGMESVAVANSFTSCYATGDVTANEIAGGFAGQTYGRATTYTKCYATGDVTSTGASGNYLGGFAGGYSGIGGATFSKCYATGDVSSTNGTQSIGGFVGDIDDVFTISNCYARGNVTAANAAYVGGFIGLGDDLTITNCYSTGAVSGSSGVGGFCGDDGNSSTITNCFWDTQTSGTETSDGGTGKTTAQMKAQATFTDAGWDFTTIWGIHPDSNGGYPYLAEIGLVLTFPRDNVSRVSAIRRIFRPGLYRMEVALGDLGFEWDVAEAAMKKTEEGVEEPEKPKEEEPKKPKKPEAEDDVKPSVPSAYTDYEYPAMSAEDTAALDKLLGLERGRFGFVLPESIVKPKPKPPTPLGIAADVVGGIGTFISYVTHPGALVTDMIKKVISWFK